MAGSASLLGSNFGSTSSTTIDVAVTLTVGRRYAIGVIGADVGSTVSAADTLSNSYTHRGSVVEAAIPRRHHGLTCAPTTGGSTTITITYPSSADNRQVYVWEIQDVGDYDAFGTATDTSNNPTTAATATNSAQPAFMLATCIDYQGGTPGVGTIGGSTGVDEGTLFVGSGMLQGRGESQSITTTGSQSANFANGPSNRTTTLLWIFLESAPPTISAQPTDQTANAGATATFSVTATGGAAPYTYQWQDDSGGSFADISGATSSSYVTAAATYSMQSRRYRCVVTGANSLSVTSDAAALRVAFNLTGTGPRAYPVLGGVIGAGSVESWLRGTDAGGAPSHSTTGALASQDATLAGSATHLTLHTTTGALSAQASTISGTAAHQHAATGALSAHAATVAGSATHLTLHTTTGALSSQAATISGTAAHEHATSGALSAQESSISGSAQHQHVATGALASDSAAISGAADHTVAGASHDTSGALSAQAATIAGSSLHLTLHAASGALDAQAATIAGTAAHQHVASSALAAQGSTLAGTAAHEHATSGALSAQAATLTGDAETIVPGGPHLTTGTLTAQAAIVSGAAQHTSANGEDLTDVKFQGPSHNTRIRWLRKREEEAAEPPAEPAAEEPQLAAPAPKAPPRSTGLGEITPPPVAPIAVPEIRVPELKVVPPAKAAAPATAPVEAAPVAAVSTASAAPVAAPAPAAPPPVVAQDLAKLEREMTAFVEGVVAGLTKQVAALDKMLQAKVSELAAAQREIADLKRREVNRQRAEALARKIAEDDE